MYLRYVLVGFVLSVAVLSFPAQVWASQVGSACNSNDDCDFNGGICWPNVDEQGNQMDNGTCTNQKLLTYQVGDSDGLLAAATQPSSNSAGRNTGVLDSIWNYFNTEEAASDFSAPDVDQNLAKFYDGGTKYGLASIGNQIFPTHTDRVAVAGSQKGAVLELAQLTDTLMWTQPANTVEYIADIGRNSGFIKEAYAQGTGWKALNPVLKLWKAFRNMAYFAFVVIFVVIGFLIMMRKKIGGQAVVTIQMALPQIVVTLLLITFSYAIVALLIDLIYVLIYFAVAMFATFGVLTGDGVSALDILMTNSIFGISMQHLVGWSDASGSAGAAINDIITSMFSSMIGEAGSEALGGLTGVLGYLIVAVVILFSVFKVFFQLLKAYIAIIFGIVFAPIILLANAFPGSTAFATWFKSILANVLVFPAIAVMILVGVALLGENNDNSSKQFGIGAGIGYDPAQVQDVALPFLGLNTSGMIAIIGLAVIVMLPHATELVQKGLGVDGSMAGMVSQAMTGAAQTGISPFSHVYNKRREQQADVRHAKLYNADMSKWRFREQVADLGVRSLGMEGRKFQGKHP